MTDELAVMEFFPQLDYHEACMFRHFLDIVGSLIRCHSNDQSGAINLLEVSEQVKRFEEADSKYFGKMSDEEKIRWAMELSPAITLAGYSRIKRTDCNEYQYGIVFAVHMRLYRDTTGLGDAIDHHASFAIKYEFNEKTNYTSKISVWEESDENFPMQPLKTPMRLPIAMVMIDKALEVLKEEYIKKRELEEMTLEVENANDPVEHIKG